MKITRRIARNVGLICHGTDSDFSCLPVSHRFLHLFLLRPTNVCTYLVIAVIRSFCKMSVLRTPGKSRDTARIRVAGR